MKTFKQYIAEELISPSKIPNTMSLWHGGNLDDAYEESINHKKGRSEYGPGLYLTTHYSTAQKYSKGSRKLYQITIKKGTDINDVNLDLNKAIEFINESVISSKRKEVINRLVKRKTEDNKVPTDIFLNILINEEAIKPNMTSRLRMFLVSNGIDYKLVPNAFGWHEMMVVLFNMKLIVNKVIVKPKDKIEVFDLPTEFN